MMADFDHLQVRVRVTSPSVILERSETARIRVPTTPPTDPQTTMVIQNKRDENIYLHRRTVFSTPQTWGRDALGQDRDRAA
jgi:hypothetical protein